MARNVDLIGESPEFLSLLRAAHLVAVTDVSVLLLGESGTGKELLARRLHADSPRATQPFIAVNCAALPESLAESELFGHRKGAFTGAISHQPGRLRAAANGTLFLDEIGELPLTLQAKLLRFLESGECQVLGQAATEQVDVRIIAATNRELSQAVAAGQFRADLYYRLNVVPLELPPLRARHGDVPLLLAALNRQLSAQYRLPAPRYNPAALRLLQEYQWPGNVRELRNLCERLLILCSNQEIGPDNLPQAVRGGQSHSLAAATSAQFALPTGGIQMEAVEIAFIHQALDKSRGNRSKAAELLGMSRDTLLYRMKKHGIHG